MKNYLKNMYSRARALNDEYVLKSLENAGPFSTMLDVGCWDGELTVSYAKACSAKTVFGIEAVKEQAEIAKQKGIICSSVRADSEKWPFEDGSLDCVVSNQVIEHLSDVDFFLAEASRVLRKGGCLITSTNNLSSWHNIGSLLFGWTPFDLTNSSNRASGIGNPLAAHRGENGELATWTHKCIYTARWLFEWQNIYGLEKTHHFGAGFYPFPASMGNLFKNHAAFMILTTKK